MIQINLIPVREIKKRISYKRKLGGYISLLVITMLSLLSYTGYQKLEISDLENLNSKIQNEKNQYTKIINQIKKIEEEKKVLETRISVIKQLKRESSLTVHILDEIGQITPSKRMWLKSLDQSSSKLILSGMALDDQTIAKYMDDLDKSRFIGNISLSNTTMDKFAERNLKSFSISCIIGIEN